MSGVADFVASFFRRSGKSGGRRRGWASKRRKATLINDAAKPGDIDCTLSNKVDIRTLISAGLPYSEDGFKSLVHKIFISVGIDQRYDFQLLFNQMKASVSLNLAHGKCTFTQQMFDL